MVYRPFCKTVKIEGLFFPVLPRPWCPRRSWLNPHYPPVIRGLYVRGWTMSTSAWAVKF